MTRLLTRLFPGHSVASLLPLDVEGDSLLMGRCHFFFFQVKTVFTLARSTYTRRNFNQSAISGLVEFSGGTNPACCSLGVLGGSEPLGLSSVLSSDSGVPILII